MERLSLPTITTLPPVSKHRLTASSPSGRSWRRQLLSEAVCLPRHRTWCSSNAKRTSLCYGWKKRYEKKKRSKGVICELHWCMFLILHPFIQLSQVMHTNPPWIVIRRDGFSSVPLSKRVIIIIVVCLEQQAVLALLVHDSKLAMLCNTHPRWSRTTLWIARTVLIFAKAVQGFYSVLVLKLLLFFVLIVTRNWLPTLRRPVTTWSIAATCRSALMTLKRWGVSVRSELLIKQTFKRVLCMVLLLHSVVILLCHFCLFFFWIYNITQTRRVRSLISTRSSRFHWKMIS